MNRFSPFVLKYHTLCLHIIDPDPKVIDKLLQNYDKDLTEMFAKDDVWQISADTQDFWHRYFGAWHIDAIHTLLGEPVEIEGHFE